MLRLQTASLGSQSLLRVEAGNEILRSHREISPTADLLGLAYPRLTTGSANGAGFALAAQRAFEDDTLPPMPSRRPPQDSWPQAVLRLGLGLR